MVLTQLPYLSKHHGQSHSLRHEPAEGASTGPKQGEASTNRITRSHGSNPTREFHRADSGKVDVKISLHGQLSVPGFPMRVDRGAKVAQPDDLSHSHPLSAHPTGHRAGVERASITFWAVQSQG
jgi:hypothetical protein